MKSHLSIAAFVACLFALYAVPAAQADEANLKVMTSLPKQLLFNSPLWKFIDLVKAKGKGVVTLKYVGGPEATPPGEQLRAVSTGIVDIQYGPNQWFQGRLPGSQAFNASNHASAKEFRDAGALAELNKGYNEKANIHMIGYYGAGYGLILYLSDKPKRKPNGDLDLSRLTIRGTGTEKAFLKHLGAAHRTVFIGELYTSLERGIVDGITYVTLAVTQLSLQKFLKYRVMPPYAHGDVALTVNLDRWKSLSGKAREVLTAAAIETEGWARAFYEGEHAAELAKLRQAGMKDVVFEDEARSRYLKAFRDSRWNEITDRLGAARTSQLKSAFTK